MALFDDADVFRAVLAVMLVPPPTRAETIKEAWRLAGDRFDYGLGRLTVAHDLDIVEPITFELVSYEGFDVIEAEGVVVQKTPRIA